jgi:hypothetical protein
MQVFMSSPGESKEWFLGGGRGGGLKPDLIAVLKNISSKMALVGEAGQFGPCRLSLWTYNYFTVFR